MALGRKLPRETVGSALQVVVAMVVLIQPSMGPSYEEVGVRNNRFVFYLDNFRVVAQSHSLC